jgi:hypothetical protein
MVCGRDLRSAEVPKSSQKPRVLPRHRFVNQLVHALEDRFAVWLGPVVAVGAVGGAVFFGGEGARFGVEVVVASVALQDVFAS